MDLTEHHDSVLAPGRTGCRVGLLRVRARTSCRGPPVHHVPEAQSPTWPPPLVACSRGTEVIQSPSGGGQAVVPDHTQPAMRAYLRAAVNLFLRFTVPEISSLPLGERWIVHNS